MTTESSVPRNAETMPTHCQHPFHHSLCWGAVLAGTAVAIGIHSLMIALGAGAGLTIFRPMMDANPIAHCSVGAAVVWSLFAIIAVSFGGWVAGDWRLGANRSEEHTSA